MKLLNILFTWIRQILMEISIFLTSAYIRTTVCAFVSSFFSIMNVILKGLNKTIKPQGFIKLLMSSTSSYTYNFIGLIFSEPNSVTKKGFCSNFISDTAIGSSVACYLRSAPSFHLPDQKHEDVPLVITIEIWITN